jgi:hypothetical protein
VEETRKLRGQPITFSGSEFLQNSSLGSFETFFDGFDKLLEGAETVEEFAVTFNTI